MPASATYSGRPVEVPRDAVRLLVGDTDVDNDPLFADAEVAWALSESGSNARNAAALLAEAAAAKFARQADRSTPDLRISLSQKSRAYRELAKDLRASAGDAAAANRSTVAPYAAGISKSDVEAAKSDTDRPDPAFEVGIHDYE